jgi:hypothetical protein
MLYKLTVLNNFHLSWKNNSINSSFFQKVKNSWSLQSPFTNTIKHDVVRRNLKLFHKRVFAYRQALCVLYAKGCSASKLITKQASFTEHLTFFEQHFRFVWYIHLNSTINYYKYWVWRIFNIKNFASLLIFKPVRTQYNIFFFFIRHETEKWYLVNKDWNFFAWVCSCICWIYWLRFPIK